jgi:hypothetical protein
MYFVRLITQGKPFPQKSYNHHHGCDDGVRIRQDSQPNCGAKGEVHRYLVLQALLQNGKHPQYIVSAILWSLLHL